MSVCYPVSHPVMQRDFFGFFLGGSPGFWAATAASYCPSRAGELPKNNPKNLCTRRDGKRGICPHLWVSCWPPPPLLRWRHKWNTPSFLPDFSRSSTSWRETKTTFVCFNIFRGNLHLPPPSLFSMFAAAAAPFEASHVFGVQFNEALSQFNLRRDDLHTIFSSKLHFLMFSRLLCSVSLC